MAKQEQENNISRSDLAEVIQNTYTYFKGVEYGQSIAAGISEEEREVLVANITGRIETMRSFASRYEIELINPPSIDMT